jgi:Lamin Tail Domain
MCRGVAGARIAGVMMAAWALGALGVAGEALAQSGPPSGKRDTKSQPAAPSKLSAEPAAPAPSKSAGNAGLHPMIVEVLYSVPTGMEGDASGDGVRSATGDEFVELVNPHDKPVQLLGYTLTDESQGEKSKVRFTFPAMELKPGEVVVVFNGYGASWSGAVGDTKAGPGKKNVGFSDAYVFTMRIANNRAAFNNSGDSVTLYSPANKAVQRVRWGTSAAGARLEDGVLDESVPDASKGSVQRIGVKPGDAWRAHSEITSAIFSPGKYDVDVKSAPSSADEGKGGGEGGGSAAPKTPANEKPESPKPGEKNIEP